jgi:hypothetical protein
MSLNNSIPTDAIPVILPRDEVLRIINSAIAEVEGHAKLADIMRFCADHSQWDILEQHIAKIDGPRNLIALCASAMKSKSK